VAQYRQQLPDVSRPPSSCDDIRSTYRFPVRHLGIDRTAIVQSDDGIRACVFFRVHEIAQQNFKVMQAVQKSQSDTGWQKLCEVVPRKEIVRRHLKKIRLCPPAKRIAAKLEFRIDG